MKCTFCSAEMEKGTGLMHVKRDGTPSYYCSRKCKKNAIKLKRKPRLTKWVYKPAKKKQS